MFLMFVACSKTLPAQSQLYMGTVCTINLYQAGTAKLYNQMFTQIATLEQLFSPTLPSSTLSQINQNAGIAAVHVSTEFMEVLQEALRIAQKTQGAFDPSIGPLVKLWGIGSDYPYRPSQEEIDKVLPFVDYTKIHIDTKNNTVFLKEKGMALDLGGIVKGYTADKLVAIAQRVGITKAFFDLGGNVYAYGSKDGEPWIVGIKDPQLPQSGPLMKIAITNKSIVTSGAYERFFEQDGKIYHHILSTKTGYPVENEVLSATIISTHSMLADALSTSLYILGEKEGMELLSTEQADGILVLKDDKIVTSPQITPTILKDHYSFSK